MGTKSKTLSITSTILLTIYTVCLVLAEAGMFAICKFAAHMTNAGIGLASNSIAAGGCVIDYATPGTFAGGMLGRTRWNRLDCTYIFYGLFVYHMHSIYRNNGYIICTCKERLLQS